MKHLFLASSFRNPIIARAIRSQIDHHSTVKTALINTTIEPPEQQANLFWYQENLKALRDNRFDYFEYSITNKTPRDIKRDLSDVDVIHITGGDTDYLLRRSYESGFIAIINEFVERGGIYIGTSAGSIIAGSVLPRYLRDDSRQNIKAINYSCYNLVNFTTVPHWGSNEFRGKYLHERQEEMYSADSRFIFLTDQQYIEVVDDNYKIVDVRGK